jgi:hypothetical protein
LPRVQALESCRAAGKARALDSCEIVRSLTCDQPLRKSTLSAGVVSFNNVVVDLTES